ncbi:MAG: hypothetical protein GY928_13230 [Colwellia sp.]|nr:hypothetical protein [Colwellia sp.]
MATTPELIVDVRFFLGNLSTSAISDADLTTTIDKVCITYPTNACDQLYYSTLATLRWLIRKEAGGSSGSAGSGAVKKRVEKEGNLSVTEEYDVSATSSTTTGWDKVLENLLKSPKTIGCTITTTTTSTGTSSGGMVLIGGVSQTQADRVYNNKDTRTATRKTRNFWGAPIRGGRY